MSEEKNKWPCPGKPEALAGMPMGMYHCEFCGEMQLAGSFHLAPQFPSQWEEPFPKVEEPPDYGPEDEPTIEEADMVAYPTSPIQMETIEQIGAPETRAPLVPRSTFPTGNPEK